MDDIAALVDRVRRQYDDECFACGRDNPLGLHLDDFARQDDTVTASFTPRAEYRGTEGVLHGGVAAAALDELLVWAGILTHGVMSVTGTLDLRFRRPATMGQAFQVRARVDERRGRRLLASGEMIDAAEREVVTASGLFLVTAEIGERLD